MAFTTLMLLQLFNVFNARSDDRSAFAGLFGNHWLWAAIGLSLLWHATVIYLPPLQKAFSTVGLSPGDWLLCAAAASTVLWLRELTKLIRRAMGSEPSRLLNSMPEASEPPGSAANPLANGGEPG